MTYKRLEIDARKNWDIFYKQNTTNFYKDRHYLKREFSELSDALSNN
jgi:methyltransferase-like protein 6